jgi:hypothetical protein
MSGRCICCNKVVHARCAALVSCSELLVSGLFGLLPIVQLQDADCLDVLCSVRSSGRYTLAASAALVEG